MPTSGTCIKCHILGKMYDVRHGMCKNCYMKVWRIENKERTMTNFGKCAGCAQEKRILFVRLGLCSYCHDNRRYGGRENYRKYITAYTREYRKTPQYAQHKIERKEQQALIDAKKRKENPEKYRSYKRRWKNRNPEKHRIGNNRRSLRWYYRGGETTKQNRRESPRRYRFFHAGIPVGPFDPNKILNERLLQGLQEVRDGNLQLPSRRPGL